MPLIDCARLLRGMQDGRTPLCCAASHGHTEVMEVLLQAEADVDSPDKVLLPPCPPISTAPAKVEAVLVAEPRGCDAGVRRSGGLVRSVCTVACGLTGGYALG